jgi:NYN domain
LPTPLSIALLDFRSLFAGPTSDSACRDAAELANELARTVVLSPQPGDPVHELRVRVYGGFRDRGGNPTPEYTGLLRHVGLIQGLDRGVRTTVDIALNVLHLPGDDLIATYRSGEQKMVDTMIAADALELSGTGYTSLTVVSNDDDFVPVLASVARAPERVQWLRRPRVGLNDAMLRRQGVVLLSNPIWP